MSHFKAFLSNESGATAIEYGLLVGLISVVLITAATTIGTKVSNQFTQVSNRLN